MLTCLDPFGLSPAWIARFLIKWAQINRYTVYTIFLVSAL